jgi:transcription initiation factor TFIIA small subunit
MAVALHTKVKSKTVMKGKLNVYRFCDDVWTFVIDNPTFKFETETVSADRIKGFLRFYSSKIVVACSAKS